MTVAGQGGPAGAVAASVIAALTERGETVAAAESLTGGLVTAALTAVPGASACVTGGVTAYATAMKATLLGVAQARLEEVGPVHPDVAGQMADGVRRLMRTDWGLATTGVAGPTWQGEQPPGTVYIAVCGPAGTAVRHLALAGDRAQIRSATVLELLVLLAGELRAVPRAR